MSTLRSTAVPDEVDLAIFCVGAEQIQDNLQSMCQKEGESCHYFRIWFR
ncbi:hypothetical protein LSPH24S_01458 [Lysinibacillus sphaericus]